MTDDPKKPERRSQDQDSAVEGAFQNSTLPEEDRRRHPAQSAAALPPIQPKPVAAPSLPLGHAQQAQPIARSPFEIPSIARESKWPSRGKIIFWTVAALAAILVIMGIV